MKTKTHVRAGALSLNHNETLVRDIPKGVGLKVKTRVTAGILTTNRNESLVRDKRRNRQCRL
jgi:hypothetical protein